jgi:Zn-dependent M28 family amino/carboxypeptidase
MLIDIARQFQKLEVRPTRTIRFVMWNGEEQDGRFVLQAMRT